jgi:VanZ family protein
MLLWFEKHHKVSWVITLFGAIAIFYISSLTFGGGGGGKGILAILYHILAFFCFGVFLLVSMVQGKRRDLLIPAAVLGVLYGVSDEIHQLFVPGRYAGGFDVFLDSVGILFAFMVYLISIEYRKLKKNN